MDYAASLLLILLLLTLSLRISVPRVLSPRGALRVAISWVFLSHFSTQFADCYTVEFLYLSRTLVAYSKLDS